MATPQTSPLPILNPLNDFPPELAKQLEFARNLFLVTLGALLCDMAVSLPEDLSWLVTSRFGATMVAYFLSRASTLAFVVSAVIVKIIPESHCEAQELGVAICWMISNASSSFLFLRRTHAVLGARRWWRHFYSCLYIVNVGISLVVPIGSRAAVFGQTGWCINSNVQQYVVAAIFSRLAFDSCVFLGISYQLATSLSLSKEVVTWRTFITGKANSRIMQSLLQGGQQYYLISVCSNLVLALLLTTPVAALYQAMFTVPDLALTSAMACRVFRNLKYSANHDVPAHAERDGLHATHTPEY